MEATIGFDLRSIVSDPGWTADRRARHLLRRDVPSVRLVDPLVWERPPGLPSSPEAEGLWSDLPDLLAAGLALDRAGAVVVRITALGEDGGTLEGLDPVGSAFERCDLLGYDVADYDLLGGLTNCGYTPEEAASLAPVWAPLLNEWHLFGDPDDATATGSISWADQRRDASQFGRALNLGRPSHGCCLCGLWLSCRMLCQGHAAGAFRRCAL